LDEFGFDWRPSAKQVSHHKYRKEKKRTLKIDPKLLIDEFIFKTIYIMIDN
jgi:hypothetical protein